MTSRGSFAFDAFSRRGGSRLSPRKGFWYAGPTYLRPGLFYTRKRLLPISEWLTRPRYKWNVRGYGRRWT